MQGPSRYGWLAVDAPRRPVLFVNPRSGGGRAAQAGLVERASERGVNAFVLGPHQNLAALSERIFDVRRVAAEVCPFKQSVFDHVAQPANQSATANRLEVGVELHGPFWSGGQISNDQHRPSVADHLQRAGNRASIKIASSHVLTAPCESGRLRSFEFPVQSFESVLQ